MHVASALNTNCVNLSRSINETTILEVFIGDVSGDVSFLSNDLSGMMRMSRKLKFEIMSP